MNGQSGPAAGSLTRRPAPNRLQLSFAACGLLFWLGLVADNPAHICDPASNLLGYLMRDPVETYMNLVPMVVEQTNRG